MEIDHDVARRFLSTAYRPDDWIGVLLMSHRTRRVAQRIVPVSLVMTPRLQQWMARENRSGANVYISANVVDSRLVSRSRRAIAAVRHLLLDADDDGARVVAAIAKRPDLPRPSVLLHSSPGRLHILWRVSGFTTANVEALQKHLARELGTDPAATACSQMTRIPGYWNQKWRPPALVTADYHKADRVYTPADFPKPRPIAAGRSRVPASQIVRAATDVVARARRYAAAVPPAIEGQHGDVQTFRMCCRLVRGFDLSDDEALAVVHDWNRRCQPPWSERELLAKIRHARRYGREPIGGLLETHP